MEEYMSNIESIAKRLVGIECPTGEVERRVISKILDENHNCNSESLRVERVKELDKGEFIAYKASGISSEEKNIIIYVDEGMDHYVAKVVETYIQ
jgi:secreted Zn-dependent insulinase-like peptidase